jgi:excinuclease UvrABC ATPase subunit
VKRNTKKAAPAASLTALQSSAQAGNGRAAARTTIAVQGARVHNLKNITLEIPRDSLIVVTGLSGSGKSSLAFDTIYAEGQRRYMESLSSFAKRFIAQVTKPDVDFVFGLSPVISIEQKTIANNPRSTVGTMTDIASYLNLLFATIAQPRCPVSRPPAGHRTRFSSRSCLCRKGRRSRCGRRCSRSTARSWISSSPKFGRKVAGG